MTEGTKLTLETFGWFLAAYLAVVGIAEWEVNNNSDSAGVVASLVGSLPSLGTVSAMFGGPVAIVDLAAAGLIVAWELQ
jgi:hypothetical protein